MRYVVELNGIHRLAVTKLDVLSGLDAVRICTAYETPEGRFSDFPEDMELLSSVKPVFETFPGWKEDLSGIRRWDDLPSEARTYLEALSETAGVEIALVSVGPDREQTLLLGPVPAHEGAVGEGRSP